MLQKETVDPNTFSFLEQIAKRSELKKFALVGGTALSLQLGHRISTDLDFFSQNDFDNVPIRDMLESGSEKVIYSRVGKNLVQATVGDIKIDFACHKYPQISLGIPFFGIEIFSIPDIAAMKLGAILSRGKKRDFVDLARIMKEYSLDQLLTFFQRKYNQDQTFHVIKAIGYFAEAEQDTEVLKLLDDNFSWEKSKRIISNSIQQLGD